MSGLTSSRHRGVIKHVRKDCVEIELDYGFVVPVGFGGFVVNDAHGIPMVTGRQQ